jgi:hypothetical protein
MYEVMRWVMRMLPAGQHQKIPVPIKLDRLEIDKTLIQGDETSPIISLPQKKN